MNSLSFFENFVDQKILVTPLNWGLGHASRCIPIIRCLLKKNQVIIGSDGLSLELLKDQFPDCPAVILPSYNINYGKRSFLLSMIGQGPKISLTISQEMAITEEIVDDFNIDIIISDHRLGCRDTRCKSIIIAHQIQIISSARLFGSITSRFNKYFINLFDECWILDYKLRSLSLAGNISLPDGLNNYKYIGPYSRLKKKSSQKDLDILVLLSGPEPSRSTLETLLTGLLSGLPFKISLVRGAKGNPGITSDIADIRNIVNARELNELISRTRLVVGRAGYSTIMDIVHLKQPAILIPTPDQPEQEYLARYGHARGLFTCLKEKSLSSNLVPTLHQLLN